MLKTVMTENGAVRGLSGNNARISVFKGIPFAAPPVGENRWRAPQPAKNWEGVRDCYKFGPISMQDVPGLGDDIYCREWHVDPEIDMDEDCLYLNVWTNAKSADDNLPVLVWFFGGAFQWGYPPEMEFNGENIAKKDVIVVSVNYRLGAFGFLSHPDLLKESPEAPTNFGLLDQRAGLKWVKNNIKAFGGNPDNVTIMGQSAGGGSVFSHLVSKGSMGLYHKAVILSGIMDFPYMADQVIVPRSSEEIMKMGEAFLESLGVKTIEEARKIDAQTLRDKASDFRNKNFFFFTPSIDGVFLTDTPMNLFLEGKHAHVPMMSGNTNDEFKSFITAENDEEFEKKAREIFGCRADEFLSFPEAHVNSGNNYASADGIECAVKVCFENNSKDSYYYLFNPDMPGWDTPGTFHSSDLWFFFETLGECWRPFVGRHFDLARKMCLYLTNFVKTGDPNGKDVDGSLLPTWLPYKPGTKAGMEFTGNGPVPSVRDSKFNDFIMEWFKNKKTDVKKQAFNPYLPSWEFIPDGEPYVFGDRVYVYGSHDRFGSHVFCLNDYVCWSAPVNDLGNWRYEGVIYERLDDPDNSENDGCLYAPDVTVGPDGRYYLFYALDKEAVISVAVCDKPAGKYKFLGYVHHEDGTRLGEKEGEEQQFDPGVMTIGDTTYLFTGFCGQGDKSRHGAMLTVLDKDMLTVKEGPRFVIPSTQYSEGTGFEGHAFFEAPSIREFDGKFYLIYSSQVMHELCYAISDTIDGEYKYGGVIVSNADIGISSYKPADMATCFGANNHGSLIEIAGKRYIFWHRQTNNDWYARQGCANEVTFREDGSIIQTEITSCGLNGGPLRDTETYPAYIACNLFSKEEPGMYVGSGKNLPRITKEGSDDDKNEQYAFNIAKNTTIGFKYFDLKGVKGVEITTTGYGQGDFEIRTEIDGPVLGKITVNFCTAWKIRKCDCEIPDGVSALYFTFTGDGSPAIKNFRFLH